MPRPFKGIINVNLTDSREIGMRFWRTGRPKARRMFSSFSTTIRGKPHGRNTAGASICRQWINWPRTV